MYVIWKMDSPNDASSIFWCWKRLCFKQQSHECHVLDSDFQISNHAQKRWNSATPLVFPTKIFVEKTKFRNLQMMKPLQYRLDSRPRIIDFAPGLGCWTPRRLSYCTRYCMPVRLESHHRTVTAFIVLPDTGHSLTSTSHHRTVIVVLRKRLSRLIDCVPGTCRPRTWYLGSLNTYCIERFDD